MEIMGYIAAALIGVSLSVVGGGGSVLTVPVMVYLFSVQPVLATSYSLFVVGAASSVGAYNNYRRGLVCIKTALLFGVSSMATVFILRKFIVPVIPQTFGKFEGHLITESFAIMVSFAVLMLVVAVYMIKNGIYKNNDATTVNNPGLYKLFLCGVAIGLVAGLLGIGGGFILIPALVLLVGIPMKQAVGTSLFIIALNSFIGFTGDIGHFTLDWLFLIKITAVAITGIFAGSAISKKLEGNQLKKIFGWFVMAVGTCILVKEIFWR